MFLLFLESECVYPCKTLSFLFLRSGGGIAADGGGEGEAERRSRERGCHGREGNIARIRLGGGRCKGEGDGWYGEAMSLGYVGEERERNEKRKGEGMGDEGEVIEPG